MTDDSSVRISDDDIWYLKGIIELDLDSGGCEGWYAGWVDRLLKEREELSAERDTWLKLASEQTAALRETSKRGSTS